MGTCHCRTERQSPFESTPAVCTECGGCPLLHRRFTLRQRLPQRDVGGTQKVYEANGYTPACTLRPRADDEPLGTAFPFGNLLVTNTGAHAVDVEVFADDLESGANFTVLPGSQVAYTGIIRIVDLTTSPDPVVILFEFDLFILPVDPS